MNKQHRTKSWKKIIRRYGLFLLILPIYLPISILLYFGGVRFLVLSSPARIGHFAAEIDYFLKMSALDKWRYKAVLMLSRRNKVNSCLLDYFSQYIRVYSNPYILLMIKPLRKFNYLLLDLTKVVMTETDCPYHRALAKWEGQPPILTLTEQHKQKGKAVLEQMGVPEGRWFVIIHSREAGYDGGLFNYRNSEIESYLLAARAVVDRGGLCIRVGDATMKPLGVTDGIIDYATSKYKSDFMDVFLCASCKMFLGNSSGLALVSSLFGVPVAHANLLPYGVSLPAPPADIGIPKLLMDSTGKLLEFADIFRSPLANDFKPEIYDEMNLTVIDNTPEEIRDLTNELLDRIDGKTVGYPDDEVLQNQYRNYITQQHYCYSAKSNIARCFLQKYKALL